LAPSTARHRDCRLGVSRTRRASRALKERLRQTEIHVVFTRTTGAVKIAADKSGWKLQTMDGQFFSGR